MQPSPSGVAPLDIHDRADVRAVAEMHLANFPATTEARCGIGFMERFYYRVLIRSGLLGCTVAHRDGELVSYISYTRYPRRILKLAARRHPLRLGVNLTWAALTRLDAIKAIANHLGGALRSHTASGAPSIPTGCGEVLLLTTTPQHQTWTPPDGTARVTVRMFSAMEDYFREHNVKRVLLMVKKGNMASNLFCHSMGCRLDESSSDPVQNYYWHDIAAGPQ